MSGHSKWANIKHRKEKSDSQRNKIYTKLGRELAIAVKEGGGNPEANGKLRDVIAKAKASNMPNDNIARAIKKASGEMGNVNYEEVTYEGYAPGGTAIIVECVTDNRNRTAADIRHIFDKMGGALGATGCVSWMFERKGVLIVDLVKGMDEDEVTMEALDAGATDVQSLDGALEVTTDVASFSAVRETLDHKGYTFLSAGIEMVPQNTVVPPDSDAVSAIQTILDKLDDYDDVQEVWHNAEMPEDMDEE